ncbi:hypothetical protein Tco_0552040 [Tanacetum coccineum]
MPLLLMGWSGIQHPLQGTTTSGCQDFATKDARLRGQTYTRIRGTLCCCSVRIKRGIITEYLVKLSKRRAFWSLNKDILKIMDSDYQYAVSIKEDTAYPCLHSSKTMKEQDLYAVSREPQYAVSKI